MIDRLTDTAAIPRAPGVVVQRRGWQPGRRRRAGRRSALIRLRHFRPRGQPDLEGDGLSFSAFALKDEHLVEHARFVPSDGGGQLQPWEVFPAQKASSVSSGALLVLVWCGNPDGPGGAGFQLRVVREPFQ